MICSYVFKNGKNEECCQAEGEDEYGRISHEIATWNVKRGLLSPIFVLLKL